MNRCCLFIGSPSLICSRIPSEEIPGFNCRICYLAFLGRVLEILFSVQFSYGADVAHLANILRTLSIESDSPSIGLSYLFLILEEILGLIFPYDPQFISIFSLYYIEKLNIYYEFLWNQTLVLFWLRRCFFLVSIYSNIC